MAKITEAHGPLNAEEIQAMLAEQDESAPATEPKLTGPKMTGGAWSAEPGSEPELPEPTKPPVKAPAKGGRRG